MHKNLNLLREKQADQPINAKVKQTNKQKNSPKTTTDSSYL